MTSVLIVDDDPEPARALKGLFRELRPDLTIVTARSGGTATRRLRERTIDLMLANLQLPDMDGLELLAWAHEHSPETELFAMSTQRDVDTDARLGELGASDYFAKPFDEQLVFARLVDAINQSVRGTLHNVSLASFLQLLEMERKSCTLDVVCNERSGLLVVSKGVLVSARTGGLQGEAAAIAVVAWPTPSIAISRRAEPVGLAIQSSLGFILIEAMRLQDEAARVSDNGVTGSVWSNARRARRPSNGLVTFESSRPAAGEVGLPSGARGLALVETATGNVLRSAASEDCPIGELARLAAQLLLQEAATLRLCSEAEAVEELVFSTRSRCDLIRPLGESEFALLVFAPEETNLVIARIELDHFIAAHQATRASGN